jgi:hypothetical protein
MNNQGLTTQRQPDKQVSGSARLGVVTIRWGSRGSMHAFVKSKQCIKLQT